MEEEIAEVSSIRWFYTLTERKDYELVWLLQNGAVQSFVQDSVRELERWDLKLNLLTI